MTPASVAHLVYVVRAHALSGACRCTMCLAWDSLVVARIEREGTEAVLGPAPRRRRRRLRLVRG